MREEEAPRAAPRQALPHTRAPVTVELTGAASDYDPLLERIGDARFVLLGEASHGTHEFYAERAAITRRLIDERDFSAVAVEADWPDAYRVNCYVRGAGTYDDGHAALAGFTRFPTWMWRNIVVLEFVEWLRDRNADLPEGRRAGFYGLDLYSLYGSIEAVIRYLDRVDPDAARRARQRYSCFEHFWEQAQEYGYATALGVSESCEREVVDQLLDLQRRAAQHDGRVARDDAFFAEQNARLVRNAERYYRAMFTGRAESWNLRDRHMAETLEALTRHLEASETPAKVVVWAHNSHLGDARATEMGRDGELNLGQLVREAHASEAVLVGFTTYTGTVTAASDWDAPEERKRVRPALPGSYEAALHETGVARSFLDLADHGAGLPDEALERAIGVIYRPHTERQSHYFHARIAHQFDCLLHFDETRAVEPLEPADVDKAGGSEEEPPETFPFGV
jgi:erythromycin esterase-like protein